MERAELIKRIRSKLREGHIEAISPDAARPLISRHGGGQLCRACDEPILGNSVRIVYVNKRGEQQFHVICDALCRRVAAEVLTRGLAIPNEQLTETGRLFAPETL